FRNAAAPAPPRSETLNRPYSRHTATLAIHSGVIARFPAEVIYSPAPTGVDPKAQFAVAVATVSDPTGPLDHPPRRLIVRIDGGQHRIQADISRLHQRPAKHPGRMALPPPRVDHVVSGVATEIVAG